MHLFASHCYELRSDLHAVSITWTQSIKTLLRYNPFAMPRRKAPEDMSVEELRRLLIEKRRGARRERLEHFKRTGRVVDVAPDSLTASAPVVETLEENGDQPQVPASK